MPRKRRRQLWFAKKKNHRTVGVASEPKRKSRQTKDDGAWAQPLPDARRSINIADKLKVVAFYNQLLKEEAEAKTIVAEPRVVGASADQRRAAKESKRQAKEILKRNKQELCKKKFPTIVGQAYVWKWRKASIKEKWDSLPPQVSQNVSTTPNLWRKRQGLSGRGRAVGQSSHVPEQIQVHLDHLVLAHARGRSDITERREAITVDTIATCRHWQEAILLLISFDHKHSVAMSMLVGVPRMVVVKLANSCWNSFWGDHPQSKSNSWTFVEMNQSTFNKRVGYNLSTMSMLICTCRT